MALHAACMLLQIQFEDYQQEEFGTELKLKNAVPQRWLSISKVLERILKVWSALRLALIQNFI
eukprot:38275-Eustigmatos_ZCMA.PRE.1